MMRKLEREKWEGDGRFLAVRWEIGVGEKLRSSCVMCEDDRLKWKALRISHLCISFLHSHALSSAIDGFSAVEQQSDGTTKRLLIGRLRFAELIAELSR